MRKRTDCLGELFYLFYCCKQLNLIDLYVFFPYHFFFFNLYGQLLPIVWDSVKNDLHKEAFPGPPINSFSFHIPVPSLFSYHHIVNITWNYLVSLLLGTVHLTLCRIKLH